jgi:hypothetical protein
MKNHINSLQEFPFTLKPAVIPSGTHQGQTEIHLQEGFTPAKMEGGTRVAPARVGARSNSEPALVLFQNKACIVETDAPDRPCIVRTADGYHAGRLSGYRGTPESLCVTIADLKPLAGRSLVLARLGAVKAKLAQKYGRLAAQSGSKGRVVVLTQKALTFRTAAHIQWLKAFRSLGLATAGKSKPISAN